MKFSGLIVDGTSYMPLNFGSDLWPLFVSRVTQKVMNGFQ